MNGVRRLLVLMGPALILCRAAFAEDVYTYWDPGSGIEASVTASKLKVAAGETVRFTSVASDIDHWVTFKPGVQSDAARDEGNVAGEGAEPDVVTYSWSSTGGRWLSTATNGPSVSWKAPNESGTYTVTLTVDDAAPDVENGSRDDIGVPKETKIEVQANRIKELRAVDTNDSSRASATLLQLAAKGEARSAQVNAIKSDPKAPWNEGEPVWSGFVSQKGDDSVLVTTAIDGFERARAGGTTINIKLDIVDGRASEFKFTAKDYAVFLSITKKLAEVLRQDPENIDVRIVGSTKKWYVDRTQSSLCAQSIEYTAGGSFGVRWKFASIKIKPPPEAEGFFTAKASISSGISITINAIRIEKDASANPTLYKGSGGSILSGDLKAEALIKLNDPWKLVSLEGSLAGIALISGELEVEREFLTGTYIVGKITVTGALNVVSRKTNQRFLIPVKNWVILDGYRFDVSEELL